MQIWMEIHQYKHRNDKEDILFNQEFRKRQGWAQTHRIASLHYFSSVLLTKSAAENEKPVEAKIISSEEITKHYSVQDNQTAPLH